MKCCNRWRQLVRCIYAFTTTLSVIAPPCFSAVVDAALVFKKDVAESAGEKIRVKGFSLAKDSGFAVLVVSADDQTRKPYILRVFETDAKSAPPMYLRSPYVAGLSRAEGDSLVVFEKLNEDPKDKRGAFRTLKENGAMISETSLEGGIAGFTIHGGSIVYLTPGGILKKLGASASAPTVVLVADRADFPTNTILSSAISLFNLPNGKVGVVSKASGKLYTATLATGAVESAVLGGPELDRARETYAGLATSSKSALQAGSRLATPTPALATTSDENGNMYTLVSPYSRKDGAMIVQTDSSGQYIQSIRIALNAFEGSHFVPAFIAARRDVLYVAAPDGKVAGFSVKKRMR